MGPKKVLVPINGTKADEEAVKLACRLAKRTKGKVYVTYVIQVDRTLPLDAEIEQFLTGLSVLQKIRTTKFGPICCRHAR
jgi:nucleotide-binding universal stress UspA family protein